MLNSLFLFTTVCNQKVSLFPVLAVMPSLTTFWKTPKSGRAPRRRNTTAGNCAEFICFLCQLIIWCFLEIPVSDQSVHLTLAFSSVPGNHDNQVRDVEAGMKQKRFAEVEGRTRQLPAEIEERASFWDVQTGGGGVHLWGVLLHRLLVRRHFVRGPTHHFGSNPSSLIWWVFPKNLFVYVKPCLFLSFVGLVLGKVRWGPSAQNFLHMCFFIDGLWLNNIKLFYCKQKIYNSKESTYFRDFSSRSAPALRRLLSLKISRSSCRIGWICSGQRTSEALSVLDPGIFLVDPLGLVGFLGGVSELDITSGEFQSCPSWARCCGCSCSGVFFICWRWGGPSNIQIFFISVPLGRNELSLTCLGF